MNRPPHIKRPPLGDDEPFPFGEHKGVPMRDVPVSYLRMLLVCDWVADWPSLYYYLVLHRERLQRAQTPYGPSTNEPRSFEDYQRMQEKPFR